jgi:hypothetical protein
MCQTTVERLFDRMWPSQIRKVASLFAQALRAIRSSQEAHCWQGRLLPRSQLKVSSTGTPFPRQKSKMSRFENSKNGASTRVLPP